MSPQKNNKILRSHVPVCESGSLVLLVSIRRFGRNYKCVGHTSHSKKEKTASTSKIHSIVSDFFIIFKLSINAFGDVLQ